MIAGCDEGAPADEMHRGVEDGAVSMLPESDASVSGSDAGLVVDADAAVQAKDGNAPVEGDAASQATSDAGVNVQDAAAGDSGANTPADSSTQNRCVTVFYRDVDGDGFGDPSTALTSCSAPAGYVDNGGDCYDANKKAYPGKIGRFATHRGDGSFDYDCDGVQRLQLDKLSSVPVLTGDECPIPPAQLPGETCDYDTQAASWNAMRDGWYTTIAPCGAEARYGTDHWIRWNDDLRKYEYQSTGLPGTAIQACN